jgi:hypothetical protein
VLHAGLAGVRSTPLPAGTNAGSLAAGTDGAVGVLWEAPDVEGSASGEAVA